MLFGKTNEEKYVKSQEYLKSMYQKLHTSFAWIPTQLVNTQWIWLQKVYFIEQRVSQFKYTGDYHWDGRKGQNKYATESEALQGKKDSSYA